MNYNLAKEARQTLGLSIAEMARACGVHRQTFVKWERGEREPNDAALQLIRLLLWLREHRAPTLKKWLAYSITMRSSSECIVCAPRACQMLVSH